MDVTNLIENFGFPIAVTIFFGYGLYKMYENMVKENAKREEKNYEMLGKFQVSIDKFADILKVYESRLGNIEKDVKDIKEIVNK